MDQQRAPLYEALLARRARGESSFHVPGHKFGIGLDRIATEVYGPIMGIDYTEISGMDDLHHPEGIIREAQELAAVCFGAEESYFLIGGSTVGNLAVITTVCTQGDLILVQRNAHKSVLHGLMLAGARAVFLQPQIEPSTGLSGGVALETMEAALERYPEAKGVMLTNPNYYGMGYDLGVYAAASHRYGIPLIVDEAHGAHFGLHRDVPPSAISRGADAVIQSTHKMLTAMTMGAMLHVQGERINKSKLKQRLAMLQSSSPSYPLMASLDLARKLAATSGERLIAEALDMIEALKHKTFKLHRIQIVDAVPQAGAYDYIDPFKLTLYDRSGTLGGFRLQEKLEAEGIVSEMADDRHAVLACSLATTEWDLSRLWRALEVIDTGLQADHDEPNIFIAQQQEIQDAEPVSEPVLMSLDTIPEHETIRIPLDDAEGLEAAESVIPYPPGIPLLYPGERIRSSVIRHIKRLALAGARFQGNLQEGAGCSILVKKSNGESNC